MPYQKKEGNSYGLAFYISLLSAVLNIKIEDSLSKSLIVGELSPFGNALKVREIKHALSICEFYDIKNVVLPEGNKEEFLKYMEHSNKSFDNVFFVKTSEEAFEILLGNNLKNLGKDRNVSEKITEIIEEDMVNKISPLMH